MYLIISVITSNRCYSNNSIQICHLIHCIMNKFPVNFEIFVTLHSLCTSNKQSCHEKCWKLKKKHDKSIWNWNRHTSVWYWKISTFNWYNIFYDMFYIEDSSLNTSSEDKKIRSKTSYAAGCGAVDPLCLVLPNDLLQGKAVLCNWTKRFTDDDWNSFKVVDVYLHKEFVWKNGESLCIRKVEFSSIIFGDMDYFSSTDCIVLWINLFAMGVWCIRFSFSAGKHYLDCL